MSLPAELWACCGGLQQYHLLNPARKSPHVPVIASMAGAAAALAANQHVLVCMPQAAASLLRALHGKQTR